MNLRIDFRVLQSDAGGKNNPVSRGFAGWNTLLMSSDQEQESEAAVGTDSPKLEEKKKVIYFLSL